MVRRESLAGKAVHQRPHPPSAPRTTSPSVDEEEDSACPADEEELEAALADIPLGDLLRARGDGSRAVTNRQGKDWALKGRGRESKMRPAEISSKVRPPKLREVIQAPKMVVRDPRFESLTGNLDTERFRKRYKFLFEEQLPAEREKLQKDIKKEKNPKVVEQLETQLSWIDKQLKSLPPKSREAEILSKHIKKEREAAKHGKQPFYLKKSEIRKMKLMEKYNELKEAGKLDKFIEKRRKKNANKDRRYMPYRRTGPSEQ